MSSRYNLRSYSKKDFLEKDKLVLEDVAADGACLYASIAKGLVYLNPRLVVSKKSLMDLSRNYIKNHQNKPILLPNGTKMTFKELVEMTHEMTMEEYCSKYTKVTSKNWGGLPEIIALSVIFDVEINIYTRESSLDYKKIYRISSNTADKIHLYLDMETNHYQYMNIKLNNF